MGGNRVARDSFYYMVAAFLPQLSGFLLLPLFSRYMSPEEYGVLSLIQVFSTFLPLVWTFQIGGSLSRYYFEYEGRELKIFVTTVVSAVGALSLVGGVLTWLLLPDLLRLVMPDLDRAHTPLFTLAIVTVFFGNLASLFAVLLRTRQEAKLFMRLSISIFAVGVALNIATVVFMGRQARGVVEAGLIVSILNLAAYAFANRGYLVAAVDWRMLAEPLRYCLPLIPHSLSNLVFFYSDRVLMAKYLPLAAIGLYSLADRVASVFKMFVTELNNAFQPQFFRSATADRAAAIREASSVAKVSTGLVSVGIAALALFSPEAVDLLLDERYFDAWPMIPLLASGWVFRSLFCFATGGLFFEKRTGRVAVITITAAMLNLGMNFALLPRFGVWAAVASTVLSFMTTYAMAELLSRGNFHVRLENRANAAFIAYMYAAIAGSFSLNSGYVPGEALEPWRYAAKLGILAAGIWLGMRLDVLRPGRLLALKRKKEGSI